VSNLSIEELYDQCEDTSEVFLYEEWQKTPIFVVKSNTYQHPVSI
jgi:hypothetical protein